MLVMSTRQLLFMCALCALSLPSCAKKAPLPDDPDHRKYAMPRDAKDKPSPYTLYTYGIDSHQLVRLAHAFEPDTNIALLPTRSTARVSQTFGGESASELVENFSRGFDCREHKNVQLCLERGQSFPDGSPTPLRWSDTPTEINMDFVRLPLESLIKLYARLFDLPLVAGARSEQVAISVMSKGADAHAAFEGILWLTRATITEEGDVMTISYEEGVETLGTTPDRPRSAYDACGVAFYRFPRFVCPDLENIRVAAIAISPPEEQETRLASRAMLDCGAEIPGFLRLGDVISVGTDCEHQSREHFRLEQIEPDSITLRSTNGDTTHTIFAEDDI